MANNRFKGEYTTSTGIKLVMDYNALATFEDISDGISAPQFLSDMEKGQTKIKDVRAFTLALMLRHQPDADLNDAGDLLSECGIDVITSTVLAASPEPEETGKKPPRKTK